MTTIYRENADRLSVADAKRLILETLPPEKSAEIYARVDENGDIEFDGPVEVRQVHGVQMYASFIDRDFLSMCEQLSIQPRMKYRPMFTDYKWKSSVDDALYTITHNEFVSLAELFGLLVVTGEAPEPQPESQPQTLEVVRNSTKPKRRDILTPVIEMAQKTCNDPNDTAAVWGVLQVLAEKKQAPLIGSTEDGLQYLEGGIAKIFKRDALRKRLAR